MVYTIDSDTRIRYQYQINLLMLGKLFCYQKKKWWGWKTCSWTFPSTHKGEDFLNVKTFLECQYKKTLETEDKFAQDIINKFLND